MIPAATLVALCAIGSAMTWAVRSLLVRALVPRFGSVVVNALRSTLSGGLLLAWVAATGGMTTLLATVGGGALAAVRERWSRSALPSPWPASWC